MLGKKKMKTFHCINLSMKGGCPDGGQLCNVVFRWTVINRTIDYNTQLLSGPKCTANLYSICLSIDLWYTSADAVQISGKFWDTQYILTPAEFLIRIRLFCSDPGLKIRGSRSGVSTESRFILNARIQNTSKIIREKKNLIMIK